MTDIPPGNSYPNADNFPEPSFPQPVTPPASDPDAGDTITVRYSQDWIETLSAAVDQLAQFSSWEGDNDAKRLAVIRAEKLKWVLRQQVEAVDCVTYSPASTFIEYFPNNPYITPDLIPEGYTAPPWYLATGAMGEPIGAVPGDVLTDITRFPSGSLPDILPASGLPRFRIHFVGEGTIAIKCPNIAAGSLIQSTIDDDPLTVQYTDVNLDVVSLPPETDNETVIEREVTGAGPHHIDCIVVSWVNDQFPFLFHGGGLRSLETCGVSIVPEYQTTPVRFNQATCTFQQSQDGGETWDDIAGSEFITACFAAALDDQYVNETGDTMTGTLEINAPNSATKNLRLGQQATPNLLDFSTFAGGSTILVPNDKGLQVGKQAVNWNFNPTSTFLQDLATLGDPGGILGVVGHLRTPVKTRTGTAGRPYQSEHIDDQGRLVAALLRLGTWQSLAYQGWDYSSTAWRKIFGLQSSWLVSTDAIRQGRVQLDVSGYDGDHEVMAFEYGDSILDLPSFGAFGHTPSQRQTFEPAGYDNAVISLVDQLNAYGWTDIDVQFGTPPTEDITTVPAWRKCSAAFFFADSLAAMMNDVFTNLTSITNEEAITELIETYRIPATTVEQVLLAFQVAYADRTGILDDLTDTDAIAATLISCDFDRTCFFDWIDVTSGWIVQTAEIVKAVLTTAWDTLAAFWFAIGQFVDHPDCLPDFELPCVSETYDFRWSSTNGWILTKGTLEHGTGIIQELEGGFYGIFVDGRFNACLVQSVTVFYTATATDQLLQMWPYEDDGAGGWTLLGVGYNQTPTLGENQWTVTFPGGGYTIDRLLVDFENEATVHTNTIQQIQVTVA